MTDQQTGELAGALVDSRTRSRNPGPVTGEPTSQHVVFCEDGDTCTTTAHAPVGSPYDAEPASFGSFGREYIHMLRPLTRSYLYTGDMPASLWSSWPVDGTTAGRPMGVVCRPPHMSRIGEVEEGLPCAPCPDPQKVQAMPGSNGGGPRLRQARRGRRPLNHRFPPRLRDAPHLTPK